MYNKNIGNVIIRETTHTKKKREQKKKKRKNTSKWQWNRGCITVQTFDFSSFIIVSFPGPLVGSLVNQFGCRPVCFAGGLITAVGFILSITTDNIVVFLLTFGVLGGKTVIVKTEQVFTHSK